MSQKNTVEEKKTSENNNNQEIFIVQQKKYSQPSKGFFNIDFKKLELVFFQSAKSKNSSFSDQEKYPLTVSVSGIIMSLAMVTGLNLYQSFYKPGLKQKKWFFFLGGFCFLTSGSLCVYCFSYLNKMYAKVPSIKWDAIEQEKNIFNKMTAQQKRQFLSQTLQVSQNQKKQKIQIAK